MIETRAPGKLFIAGEYAVVEPGQSAVLIAVDRCITVRLTESEGAGRIHSSEYGQAPVIWRREDDGEHIIVDERPFDYVLSAISTVEELRSGRGARPRYFDLEISSELNDADGRKFGLGSSAAVTVATIAALDEFYELGLTLTERFKLAVLATIAISTKASGGDLAASTFGGWIRYSSPDRAALHAHREAHGVVSAMTCAEWADCSARRVTPPSSLDLLVGWTGSPASTEHLVTRVHSPNERADDTASERADDTSAESTPAGAVASPPAKTRPLVSFAAESQILVDDLVAAFDADDAEASMTTSRSVRALLQRLSDSTRSLIETEALHDLCEIAETHGAAAKPSGAGGGDCGIALAHSHTEAQTILSGWEAAGIRPLDLGAHREEGEIDEF